LIRGWGIYSVFGLQVISSMKISLEAWNLAVTAVAEAYEVVDEIAEIYVRRAVYQIPQLSPILKELHDNGAIKIVGGLHDISTGLVKFYE
jgi:hypothetical protein